jgi:hypothetical protein
MYLSFVEEMVMNPDYKDWVMGRAEVYDNEDRQDGYASDEIRFHTKNREEFWAFREEYDLIELSRKDCEAVIKEIEQRFQEPLN